MTDTDAILEFMGLSGKGYGDHNRMLNTLNRNKERPKEGQSTQIRSEDIPITRGRTLFKEYYVDMANKLKVSCEHFYATKVQAISDEFKEYVHYEVTALPITP